MTYDIKPYIAPQWATSVLPPSVIPTHKVEMARLPTPIQRWNLPGLPDGVNLYIKRDDLTGMQLSGNKIRKLEFIFADVIKNNHDSIITLGGIQSNHARATAVAARYLGLESHLILRTSRTQVENDPGLDGNLMIERLVGAHIHLVTKEEYSTLGQKSLGNTLLERLKTENISSNPYLIPVGGSSCLGTWGYIEMMRELLLQQQQQQEEEEEEGKGLYGIKFTDICMACGSGGTTAGIALGNHLSGMNSRIHGFMVCDDTDYFVTYINTLFEELGATPDKLNGQDASTLCRYVLAKGNGYALAREEELQFLVHVAKTTGILLDPVYTGKAAYSMLREMQDNPDVWKGRNVLFLHTGGALGLYGSTEQLLPLIEKENKVYRMEL